MHSLLRIIPSLLLTMLGGFLVFGSIFDWPIYLAAKDLTERGDASQQWPSTRGRIVQTKMETSSRMTSGRSSKEIPIYLPVVIYHYQPDGSVESVFEGDTIQIGLTWSKYSRDAKDLLARYPVGASVDVYYDPNNPQKSVLKTGAHPSAEQHRDAIHFEAVSLGVIGGLISVFSLLNAVRRWRQKTPRFV